MRALLTALALLTITAGGEATTDQTLAEFQAVTLGEFTVLLSSALQQDRALQERLLWRVEEQLQATLKVLPPHTHASLRGVRLWVDSSVESPSALSPLAWYIGRDAPRGVPQRGDIVLVDAAGFIEAHGQMNVMLHEFAHAYDDRILHFGNAEVQAAFEHARRAGLYQEGEQSQYARVNPHEYFAELSVAYFGARPRAPHNRAQLRQMDPRGHAAIRRAWAPAAMQRPAP